MPVEAWAACFSDHPDRAYCNYLLWGLREGFHIGYQQDQMCCRSTLANMQSTAVWPEVISSFLEAKVQAGQILGPVGPKAARAVQVNTFGLVPWSRRGGDAVSIMALSQTCVASATPPWMRHVRGWWLNEGAPVWLCSMWKEHFELCQCTQTIGGWLLGVQ